MSEAEFRRTVRRDATPVVLKGAIDSWPAVQSWLNPERMVDLVGADTEVFCRQVTDPAGDYAEEYLPIRFGDFVQEIFELGVSSNYLTQGLVFEPEGLLRSTIRTTYPALLQDLAADVGVPDIVPRSELLEGVMWMGVGSQVTPLHFDEPDNVNCLIEGRKRWVLFPPSERRHLLLEGETARGSVLSSIEQLTEGATWRGGPLEQAYTCETGPGDSLFVPAGYAHQVYSSSESSIAINFWLCDTRSPRSLARLVRDRSLRRMGFDNRLRRAVWAALFVGGMTALQARYLLRPSSMPEPDLRVGPTSYISKSGL